MGRRRGRSVSMGVDEFGDHGEPMLSLRTFGGQPGPNPKRLLEWLQHSRLLCSGRKAVSAKIGKYEKLTSSDRMLKPLEKLTRKV